MSTCPKASWPWVKTLLHSVYDQPEAKSVAAQYDRVLSALAEKLPQVLKHLERRKEGSRHGVRPQLRNRFWRDARAADQPVRSQLT